MSNYDLHHEIKKFYDFMALANAQLLNIVENSPHFIHHLEEKNQTLFEFANELNKDGYERGRLGLVEKILGA